MSPRDREPRPILRTCAIYLLAGLLTSIAVAIVTAQRLWQDGWAEAKPSFLVWSDSGTDWSGAEWRGAGFYRMNAFNSGPGFVEMAMRSGSKEEQRRPDVRTPDDVHSIQVFEFHRSGWPFPALKYGHVMRNGPDPEGDPLQAYWGVNFFNILGKTVVVPHAPTRAGLALDTAVFGAALLSLDLTIHHLRGMMRRRRGWCPICAYDLAHGFASGCPECGWGRPKDPSSPMGSSDEA